LNIGSVRAGKGLAMSAPEQSDAAVRADEAPSREGRRLGPALFLFALCWFLLWGRGMPPTGDERETLEAARGLFYLGRPERLGLAGERLGTSKYGIGQSLVDLPGVAAEGLAGLLWPGAPGCVRIALMQLPGTAAAALAVWLLFAIGRRLDYGPRRSAAIALGAALSSPLWPYSRTLFADLTVAVTILGAFWAALRFETEGRRARDAALEGLFLAFGMATKFGAAISIPLFGLHALWAGARGQSRNGQARPLAAGRFALSLAAFAAPLALGGGWLLLFNRLRYGRWLETGYWVSADESFGFGTPLWVGLYGMLFSSGKSVFLYSPLLVGALWGWAGLLRRRAASGALLASIIAAGLLFYARWWAWHGDWCWANRHILYATLLGLIPLGELGAGASEARGRRRWRLAGLWSLAAAGLAVNLLGVVVWRSLPFYLGSTMLQEPVFKRPLYEKGTWEIRDDFAHFHFIPEFSPLATHLWLARAIWNRERWSGEEIARRAPWMRLNAAWKPRIPEDYRPYLAYDTWWHGQWAAGLWSALESVLLAVLSLGALGSGLGVLRALGIW